MNISVIGTGYVGLVSGTCFSDTGNQVICMDVDERKVESLRNGKITIYEPGLDAIFQRNIAQGRLQFTTDLKAAVDHADIIFLALPTPPDEDGSADLSYVLQVAEKLGPMLDRYRVIVNKSTVPIGTADLVTQTIQANAGPNAEFDVVSNPEFLREGVAVDDFMRPDRVVIGTSSSRAELLMRRLYEPFVRQGNPIYFMDVRSAEMTKYAANSYLATRITFMNEIANLCEKLGANVDNVRIGMGSDSRIGKRFLFPGIGFGGSCFPKDVSALEKIAGKSAYDFKILQSVLEVNDQQRISLMPKIQQKFGNDLSGKRFAVWGLAFKPNTDDIREAPALYTIDRLLAAGAEVHAYDPEAMENVKAKYGDRIHFHHDAYSALQDADALLIMTEWQVFRTPDFKRIASVMPSKTIFDGRNLYSLDRMKEHGFHYVSVGRAVVEQ